METPHRPDAKTIKSTVIIGVSTSSVSTIISRTRERLRFRRAAAGGVVVEVRWCQWVLPRDLHQVGLGSFLQLGKNVAPAALRGAVHLKDLKAKLLSAGVHRGGLAHTCRSRDQGGAARRRLSGVDVLRPGLALEVSTVPRVCTRGPSLLFHTPKKRGGGFPRWSWLINPVQKGATRQLIHTIAVFFLFPFGHFSPLVTVCS